tara:strand:- start:81 stop:395 length:315 start_codon:yes stop_codon:yes gene_type:complete
MVGDGADGVDAAVEAVLRTTLGTEVDFTHGTVTEEKQAVLLERLIALLQESNCEHGEHRGDLPLLPAPVLAKHASEAQRGRRDRTGERKRGKGREERERAHVNE